MPHRNRATLSASFVDAAGDTLGIAEVGIVETGARTVRWTADAWSLTPPEDWEERATRVVIEARPTYSSRLRFSRIRDLEVVWVGP